MSKPAFLALMRAPGKVFTRRDLLEEVWGFDSPVDTRAVDLHVSRVRRKLGGGSGKRITAVRGIGYRFARSKLPVY